MSRIESQRVVNDPIALSSTFRVNVAKHWSPVPEHIILGMRCRSCSLKANSPQDKKTNVRKDPRKISPKPLCESYRLQWGVLRTQGGRSMASVFVLFDHLEPAVVSADAAM